MFLKLGYLPSKLRLSGKYLFLGHQISVGQLSADSFSTETLLFKSKSLARDLIVNYYSALGGFVGSTPEKAFSSIEMRVLHV